MQYDADCSKCGRVEVSKRMTDPMPMRHACGGKLVRVFTATPIHYNAPGFYASDVTHFRNQVGPERFAKFEKRRANIEARAAKGQLTTYERALE